MANLESSRPTRNTAATRGKLRKKSGEEQRTPDAYFNELQKTGWTPELEADLFAAPAQLQIQPELLEGLIHDARQRGDAKLWRLLACVCEGKGEDHYAVSCATEALQLHPTDITAMGVLARLCEKRHAEQEAANWYRQILAIDPTQVDASRFLAQLHYQRGEYEPALQYLNQLIEIEPKVRTNKLYWLLSTVKSTGIHGLAQPLTEVRRWRTFTPEETPLAYELFLLVAKLCLHARQRARAKQYLTRAQQLDPTAEEIETLLAELSDRLPTTAKVAISAPPTPTPTSPVKTPVSIPHPSGPIRLKYPVVPHPPVVLPEGAWNGRPRVMPLLTSGVGAIAALLAVAVLVIWSLPDDPPSAALPYPREKRAVSPNANMASSVPTEEGASLNQKPIVPQPQSLPFSSPSATVAAPASVVVPPQPEAKKLEVPTPAAKILTQASVPENTPNPVVPPQANVTHSAPTKPTTDTVAQTRVAVPAPPVKASSQTALPVSPPKPVVPSQPNVTPPVPQKPGTERVAPERVVIPLPSPPPTPPAQKVVEKPPVLPPVTVAKENTSSVPPGKLNVHSSPSFFAPTNSENPTPSPSQPPGNHTTQSQIVSPAASATVEKPHPLNLPVSRAAVAKDVTREKPDAVLPQASATTKAAEVREEQDIPPASSREPNPPEAEETPPTSQVVAAKGDPDASRSVKTPPELNDTVNTGPAREEDKHNTDVAAADKSGQSPPPSDEQNTAGSTDMRAEEDDRAAAVNKNTSTTQAGDSTRITRLSQRFSPYASRFPVRERLVSVPPEKLLADMPELMKQEIGDSTVKKISSGVIRARVSGKPRDPARPPKEYGQYLVEVVPGPTQGTSRVRTQVLLFDWRTGEPIEDADTRADRLLKKITD